MDLKETKERIAAKINMLQRVTVYEVIYSSTLIGRKPFERRT